MKILHTVESYTPMVHGMQEVVKQLSERMAAEGHDVTVATSHHPGRAGEMINGVRVVSFAVSGQYATGYHGDVKSYEQFLLHSDYDIIVNFASQNWATDLCLPLLDRIRGKKIFVPTGFSGLYRPLYQDYYQKMPQWLRAFDACIFLSHTYRDVRFAREHGVTKIHVIPNGASGEEFAAQDLPGLPDNLGISGYRHLILSVGSHTGIKGHKEALQIFKKARIRDAVFLMVGNTTSLDSGLKTALRNRIKDVLALFNNRIYTPCQGACMQFAHRYNKSRDAALNRKKIVIASLNREQTVAAYLASNLFFFPSNIECSPIVIFEAMASKTPFLATDVGNIGEVIEWTNGAGMLLPTRKDDREFSYAAVQQSAAMLADVLQNEALLSQMAEKGYGAFKKEFTWQKIAHRYLNLYQSLTNPSTGNVS